MGYLLDTTILAAFLNNRMAAVQLVSPWMARLEAVTSILAYGEILEHIMGLSNAAQRKADLRSLMGQITPLVVGYPVVERYASLRRALRPPHGPGLIGDIDTLIAATAIERTLTLVTTDTDFQRVPGLSLMLIPRAQI